MGAEHIHRHLEVLPNKTKLKVNKNVHTGQPDRPKAHQLDKIKERIKDKMRTRTKKTYQMRVITNTIELFKRNVKLVNNQPGNMDPCKKLP